MAFAFPAPGLRILASVKLTRQTIAQPDIHVDLQNADNGGPPAPSIPPGPQAGSDAAPRRSGRAWYRDPLLILALAAVLGLDQFTKWLVTSNMTWGQSIPAEGFVRLTYVHNTGSAFGLFQNQGMILTIIAFVAVAAMIWLYRSSPMPSVLMRAALGLQIGGAIGNLIDRLRLGFVVDFVDIGPWPVFNVADSSIVVGIVILAWYFGTGRDLPERGRPGEMPPDGDASEPPAA